jgi:hypothetical protein
VVRRSGVNTPQLVPLLATACHTADCCCHPCCNLPCWPLQTLSAMLSVPCSHPAATAATSTPAAGVCSPCPVGSCVSLAPVSAGGGHVTAAAPVEPPAVAVATEAAAAAAAAASQGPSPSQACCLAVDLLSALMTLVKCACS